MPEYWQVTKDRAEKTDPVWALHDDFLVRGYNRSVLTAMIGAYATFVGPRDDAQHALDTHNEDLKADFAVLRDFAIRGAGKLSADLPEGSPLLRSLGRVFDIDPDTETAILSRCRALAEVWEGHNEALAAGGGQPFKVRDKTLLQFRTLIAEAEGDAAPNSPAGTAPQDTGLRKRGRLEVDLAKKKSLLENHNTDTDKLCKAFHKAWRNEFEEGSPEMQALAQVPVEEGAARPIPIEIDQLTQLPDRKVRVTHLPGGGEHATLLQVQHMVEGVDVRFGHETPLDRQGNDIGPFAIGAVVKVRDDVGNSRYPSVPSAVKTIVIA